MSNGSVYRWIVLEAPRPAEDIVAALRLQFRIVEGQADKVGIIDILCGQKVDEGNELIVKQCLLQLLHSTEKIVCSVINSESCVLVVTVNEYRSDLIDLLSTHGYEDKAGGLMDNTAKPTMCLEYHKQLVNNKPAANGAKDSYLFPCSDNSHHIFIEEDHTESTLCVENCAELPEPVQSIQSLIVGLCDHDTLETPPPLDLTAAEVLDDSSGGVIDMEPRGCHHSIDTPEMRSLIGELFVALHKEDNK